MNRPLEGVKIVEVAMWAFVPAAGGMLSDMGADVIKIEPPEGDNTRYISVGPAHGMSGVFVNVNRGKRSIVLDLRSDADKATLRNLIANADVFIHSMRSKAIIKLGFGYEDVAAVNKKIVYTNCYGYGRRGPDRDLHSPAALLPLPHDVCIAAALQKLVLLGRGKFVPRRFQVDAERLPHALEDVLPPPTHAFE